MEKKRGRPPQGETAKRAAVGLRVTPALKERAERAAAMAGRSLSQEMEFRIEASFRDDDLAALPIPGPRSVKLMRRLQSVIALIEAATGESWSTDGATSAAVRVALNNLLDVDMPADPAWVEAFEKVRAKPDDAHAAAEFEAIDKRHKEVARRAVAMVVQIAWRHPGHINPDGTVTPVASLRRT